MSTSTEEKELTTPFNWDSLSKQDLEKICDRLVLRVHQDATCEICGEPFWKHPLEPRITDFQDQPYLHRLCEGILGKL